jgi:hypothetical protein
MAEFAATYAHVALRDIPGADVASGVAPETPLGALPAELARPVIRSGLRHAARAGAYAGWAERRQEATLDELRCRRDRLPTPGGAPLEAWLPFLEPVPGA